MSQLTVQPGAGKRPIALGGPEGNIERLSRLRHGQTGEKAQLDKLCGRGIDSLQSCKGCIEGLNIVRGAFTNFRNSLEIDALSPAPVLDALFPAGSLDKNATNGFRGGRKKMSSAVPALSFVRVYEPYIRFMNQGRGLERLALLFLRQLLRRKLAKLVVNQRQKSLGGVGVALLNSGQDARDLTHTP